MERDKQVSVSIIIPVYNEGKYIEECIKSVVNQDYPKDELELLLVDGNSQDNTVEIIRKMIKEYPFIRVLNNPKRTVQYALNIGIKNAVGTYIVRMDAHAEYANDYVSKCISCLKRTGADNVGGSTNAQGKTECQKAIAAAYHSPFALGGGTHYIDGYEGYADTVSWGAFKKQTLLDIGMYDERLPRSEDDDLNFRITESGGTIYISSQIKSTYFPRDSYIKLFKQYFEYGVWKIAVIKKHKKPARIAHLVPMLFVLFLITFGIGSIFSNIALYTFLSVLMIYLILDFYFSFKNHYVDTFLQKLKLVYVHFILHISYGLGFIVGIFKFLNTKWS